MLAHRQHRVVAEPVVRHCLHRRHVHRNSRSRELIPCQAGRFQVSASSIHDNVCSPAILRSAKAAIRFARAASSRFQRRSLTWRSSHRLVTTLSKRTPNRRDSGIHRMTKNADEGRPKIRSDGHNGALAAALGCRRELITPVVKAAEIPLGRARAPSETMINETTFTMRGRAACSRLRNRSRILRAENPVDPPTDAHKEFLDSWSSFDLSLRQAMLCAFHR